MNKSSRLTEKFKDIQVLVVGDVFLDHYIHYDPTLESSSLETGLKPVVAIKESFSPGGAGNVAKALSFLGARVNLVGVTGEDGNAFELIRALENLGIKTKNLVRTAGRSTSVYTKFINLKTNEEDLPRVDTLPNAPLCKETVNKIVSELKKLTQYADAIVVVDQVDTPELGVITDKVKSCLDDLKDQYPSKIFIVDSRSRPYIFSGYVLKPNLGEFAKILNALHISINKNNVPLSILTQCHALELSKTLNCKLVITASEDGAYVAKDGELFRVFSNPLKVVDVCGAGDTFMAAFTLAASAQKKIGNQDIIEAVSMGERAAGVCVTQHGTGKVGIEDLLSVSKPETGKVTAKEIFLNFPDKAGKIKFVLFDFDGTLSLLREGWQSIMKPLMLEAITRGKNLPDVDLERLLRSVEDYIDRTTGQQTILQMKNLEKMVRDYGLVPADEVKTPLEYKALYNSELKKVVKERMQEDDPSKYLLKGSFEFIKAFYDREITLLLASGTDIEDVEEESKFLGVYDFFTGGVYGAVRDYKKYSKEKVIKNLLHRNSLRGKELLVVGDGPVEISVGRSFGAFTIGVASDEKQGYGWNLKKFQRLKKCGANILIPDFTAKNELMDLLNLSSNIM